MSTDPNQPGGGAQPESGEQMTPEQEQMMRQMEEEMSRVRVQDVITQSVVSILNLSARRIAKDDERDLEQAKAGIEAVRALVDQLEPEPQREVRNALSQIQVMYGQHAGEGAEGAEEPGAPPPQEPPQQPPAGGAGTSKLWTPGG